MKKKHKILITIILTIYFILQFKYYKSNINTLFQYIVSILLLIYMIYDLNIENKKDKLSIPNNFKSKIVLYSATFVITLVIFVFYQIKN
jgi:hypothetical protein